jgi:hypothetical protein
MECTTVSAAAVIAVRDPDRYGQRHTVVAEEA